MPAAHSFVLPPPQPVPLARVPSFLLALDIAVREDASPSGLSGALCIGVAVGTDIVWWHASFGQSTETAFLDGRKADVTASALIGENEASALAGQGALPAEPTVLAFEGDDKLFARFSSRYGARKNWLSVRTGDKS